MRPLTERLLGRSVVWAEGQDHKRQRYQLAPFFTYVALMDLPQLQPFDNLGSLNVIKLVVRRAQATQDMFKVVQACAHTGSDRLAAHVTATAGAEHESKIDITDWTWRVTLDIIGRVAFDHDFGCGESEDAKILQSTWRTFVNASLQKAGFIVSWAISYTRMLLANPSP